MVVFLENPNVDKTSRDEFLIPEYYMRQKRAMFVDASDGRALDDIYSALLAQLYARAMEKSTPHPPDAMDVDTVMPSTSKSSNSQPDHPRVDEFMDQTLP